jgi:alkylation response protein AidB-like acyl-CoA dehydrogenase
MYVDYPKELDGFRADVRGWLEQHLPDTWFDPAHEMSEAEREKFNREWPRHLAEGGWVCASWPKEYGGKGLSTMESVIVAEEFQRAGAPMRADFFGDTLVGPTILQWGTEAQKQEFIPKILSGEIAWCQGFSEPDAGSDLGSLKTTAVLDGDEWVINGQKIWTTQGMEADYIFVLCRTDPAAAKHKGISYLLCPMRQAGVEVRRIRQPDGGSEFCEVFFTDARCPAANVVGGVNEGWKVAMTTLGFERGVNATTSYRRFERELDHIIDLARANGTVHDPVIRQRLARCWSKVQIMRINGLRSLSSVLHGKSWSEEQRRGVSALSATNKMFWSEYHQEVMELAMDILGMRGQILEANADTFESVPGYGRRKPAPDYPSSALQSSFFFSRSETIWGGSGEIQRNIVGERSLGLPREPREQGR